MRFTLLVLLAFSGLLSCTQSHTPNYQATQQEILSRIKAPQFPDTVFNVMDYGAIADAHTDCKPAFDQAIAACHKAGGGKVVVPIGSYFLEGPIHFESNVNLHLKEGAVLLFSSNAASYPNVLTSWEGTMLYNFSPFIYAFQKENIAITGQGIINGQSARTFATWRNLQQKDQLLSREMNHNNTPLEERIFGLGHYLRPQLIQFLECKNILVEGIIIEDSPFWCLHLLKSQNATLRGLRFYAQNKNNDGIDLEYSKDILIENVHFDNNDDNIAIKAGRDHEGRSTQMPSENIVVRHCHFKGLHAVVIGSEMSSGVRNVFVSNCDSRGYVKRGIYLKSNPDRGGEISNIYVNNVSFGEVLDCFVVTSNYHNEGEGYPTLIHNIHLKNIQCEDAGHYGMYVKGYSALPIRNITVENFTVNHATRGVFVDYADKISFKNARVNGKEITWKPRKLRENPTDEYDY